MKATARTPSTQRHIVRVAQHGLTCCPTCQMFIRVAGTDHETRCVRCGVVLQVQLVAR